MSPNNAGGNQELTPMESAISLTKGERVLPNMPTTLVHPNPILRTSVGQSSAMKTQKMDQKQQRTKRFIMRAAVSNHLSSSRFPSFYSTTIMPRMVHRAEDTANPIIVAFLRRHLSIRISAEMQPIISPIPNRIWLVSLLKPTLLWFRFEEQYIAWIPKSTIAPEMEVHRTLLNLKRSKKPKDFCQGCSSCLSSQWSKCSKSSCVISGRLLTFAIRLSVTKASSGCFLRKNMGVQSSKHSIATATAINRPSIMYIMPRQVSPVWKTRATVVSPTAQATCTPTPYLCLLLPKQISLTNEKQSVMAGLVPKPTKNRPKPTIFTESAMQVTSTATLPIAQAMRMASLRPKLSAMKGMTKKPKMAPTNIIS